MKTREKNSVKSSPKILDKFPKRDQTARDRALDYAKAVPRPRVGIKNAESEEKMLETMVRSNSLEH